MASVYAIIGAILLVVASSQVANAGPWETHYSKAEMDDSEVVILWTASKDQISDSLGLSSVRPELVVRCSENRTVLYVDWKMYISTGGIDNDQAIRYRVDQDKARKETWDISTNFEATGLWSGAKSISLIKRLVTAKRMIVETTPYGRNAVTATFDVEGLDKHIDGVKKACHWN